MAKEERENLSDLYAKQFSLTEWLGAIGFKKTDAFRKEEIQKEARLGVLNRMISLPVDTVDVFEAVELVNRSARYEEYLTQRGDELTGIELVSHKKGLRKLRVRGLTKRDAHQWFQEQDVVPEEYRIRYTPHDTLCNWSTIFVVNKSGIHGEIIAGGHYQLTQGVHDTGTPIVFRYDFINWSFSAANKDAEAHVKSVVNRIKVDDTAVQGQLTDMQGAAFSCGYICGYFETIDTAVLGLRFLDYNQSLGELAVTIPQAGQSELSESTLSGHVGCAGTADGVVQVVDAEDIATVSFDEGAVLVCSVVTPAHISCMQKASAVVTDQGGILSHAAIVARELGVPCIVGTGNATQTLKTGDQVRVDADRGVVGRIQHLHP